MKINENHIRKMVRKALFEASEPKLGIGMPDQATSRKQQQDNKIDDKRLAAGKTALSNLATNLLKNKSYSDGDGNLETFLSILNGAKKNNTRDFESFIRNDTIKSAYDKYNKDLAVPKKKSSGQASSKKKAPQQRKRSSFKFPVSDKVKAIQKTVGAPSSKTTKGADGKWGKNTSAAFAAWLKKQDLSKLKKPGAAKPEEPKAASEFVNTPAGGIGSQLTGPNENISRRQLRLMINEVLRTGRSSIIKEAATKEQAAMIDANLNNPVAIAKELGYTADLEGIENLIKALTSGKDKESSLSFEYNGVDYTQNTDSDGNVTYSEDGSNETIDDPELESELEEAALAADKPEQNEPTPVKKQKPVKTWENVKKDSNFAKTVSELNKKYPKLYDRAIGGDQADIAIGAALFNLDSPGVHVVFVRSMAEFKKFFPGKTFESFIQTREGYNTPEKTLKNKGDEAFMSATSKFKASNIPGVIFFDKDTSTILIDTFGGDHIVKNVSLTDDNAFIKVSK